MRNYQVTVTYDIVAESEDRAKQFVQWHMRQSQALVRQKLEDAGANDGKLTGVHQPHWVMPHVRYVMQDFPAELERELEDKIVWRSVQQSICSQTGA